MDVTIDFELKSSVNLKKQGLYVYTRHPSTSFLCGCFMVEDYAPKSIEYTMPWSDELADLVADTSVNFHAWNAQMEIEVWKNIMTPRHGWPTCPPLHRWRDTMPLAGIAGYPQDLQSASELLGNTYVKMREGKDLLNLFSKPDKKGDFLEEPKLHPRWPDLIKYNRFDVLSEREIYHKLKWIMPPSEQLIWEHVVLMNQRGLPIDTRSLYNIIRHIDKDIEFTKTTIDVLTNGEITSPTQGERIKKYLERYGLKVDSLTSDVVDELLRLHESGKVVQHGNVVRMLNFRKLSGGTAISKFHRMDEMLCPDKTVKGGLAYYGAGPGRHAGRGIQPQNFPRFTIKNEKKEDDTNRVLDLYNTCDFDLLSAMMPVSAMAKGLIRATIKAPDGSIFYIFDFSGVEARAVAWVCDEQELIKKILAGMDMYRVQASAMFKIPYESISKTSPERQAGKICVLACGYAGGYIVFLKEAKKSNFECTEKQAKEYVRSFRDSRPNVAGKDGAWQNFQRAIIEACSKPGEVIKVDKIRTTLQVYRGYLRMYMPCGRYIYYPEVRIDPVQNKFGQPAYAASGMWVNSMTHKWERRELTGPLLFQNYIQGLCRDLLTSAQLRLELFGYPQYGSVHDEGIAVMNEATAPPLEDMKKLVLTLPEWAKGFPIGASIGKSYRYGKD